MAVDSMPTIHGAQRRLEEIGRGEIDSLFGVYSDGRGDAEDFRINRNVIFVTPAGVEQLI
jgi:hypothetical protein